MTECSPQIDAPPRYRFSLFWVFEVITIIAVSLALHRDPQIPLSLALMLVWSAACGAYLGYRWRSSDDISSCGRLTIGLSALITFLNALALGITLCERAKRESGRYSFAWEWGWPVILMLSIYAALMGMSLGGIFGAGAAYWREQIWAKRSGKG